jgi:hypothetical protein
LYTRKKFENPNFAVHQWKHEGDDYGGAEMLVLDLCLWGQAEGFKTAFKWHAPGWISSKGSLCIREEVLIKLVCVADQGPFMDNLFSSGLKLFDLGALHHAAMTGAVEVCKAILKHGIADVNQKIAHDQTPLHYAVKYNRPAVCSVLLGFGANLDAYAKGPHGGNVVTYALDNHQGNYKIDCVDALDVLWRFGVDFDRGGMGVRLNPSYLAYAVLYERFYTVQWLIHTVKVDINRADRSGYTPLVYSLAKDIKYMKELLEAGAEITFISTMDVFSAGFHPLFYPFVYSPDMKMRERGKMKGFTYPMWEEKMALIQKYRRIQEHAKKRQKN